MRKTLRATGPNRAMLSIFQAAIVILVLPVDGIQARSAAPASPANEIRRRVEDLVSRTYYHGMKRDDARKVGPNAIPILEAILNDDTQKWRWKNAVEVVALLNDDASLPVLRRFIWARFDGPVDNATEVALFAAQDVVGAIEDKGSRGVVAYLRRCASPSTWKALKWHSKSHTDSQVHSYLTLLSINGLGRQGTQQALRELEAMRENPPTPYQMGNIEGAITSCKERLRIGNDRYESSHKAAIDFDCGGG